MKLTGRYVSSNLSLDGKLQMTVSVNEKQEAVNQIDDLKDVLLDIELKEHKDKRSLDANRLLWACIGEIASCLRTDKWQIYLMMLRRYGKYTYICVTEKAVESVKKQWRETEVVGEIDIHGKKAIQMLCYFGSHTYNSKEFSVLIDGVVSEMKELNLQPPATKDMKRIIEAMERKEASDDTQTCDKRTAPVS